MFRAFCQGSRAIRSPLEASRRADNPATEALNCRDIGTSDIMYGGSVRDHIYPQRGQLPKSSYGGCSAGRTIGADYPIQDANVLVPGQAGVLCDRGRIVREKVPSPFWWIKA
jgi:hypothetical protein